MEIKLLVFQQIQNGWRIFGLDENTDEIMLISADSVKTIDNKSFYLRGQTGYQYGVEEINNICKLFGYGKGANGARSINVEDINKVTGYNPEKTGNGNAYGKGQVEEYNNNVTYTKQETGIHYIGDNGTSGIGGDSTTFLRYYDASKDIWNTLDLGESENVRSSTYWYYPTTLTTSKQGDILGISQESKEYDILFSNSNENYYWLANTFCYPNIGRILLGMRRVHIGSVGGPELYTSTGKTNEDYGDIRPIVNLNSDINIEGGTGKIDDPYKIK